MNSYFKNKKRCGSMCMTKIKDKLNINDFSYNDIETEVKNFLTNPTPLTIITGSSSHMIEKVENVVSLINPNYDLMNNGLRVWKEVA